jgi:hypothetical protein
MLHESIPGFATIGKNRNAKRKHENLENRLEILRLLSSSLSSSNLESTRETLDTLYTLYTLRSYSTAEESVVPIRTGSLTKSSWSGASTTTSSRIDHTLRVH